MADILSDIYGIPVEFADGQQPSAAFLNAWANQIDTAFGTLARIIGDFDGESSERAAYISNLVRSLGTMGWLNPRLPRGIANGVTAPNNPTLIEELTAFQDKKEALLTFYPITVEGDFDGDDAYDDDWTEVATVAGNTAQNLSAVDRYLADGRRILTSTVIPAGAKIRYRVDPDISESFDAYSEGSGSNVIPSLYEIAAVSFGDDEDQIDDLCTFVDDAGTYYIEFPYILRCMNPSVTQDVDTYSSAIDLTPDALYDDVGGNPSTLKWSSLATTPKYTVPEYIYDIATGNGLIIPEGLVSLWVDNGGEQYRITNHNSDDQIVFSIVAGDYTKVKIELPAGFTLPHDDDGALINKYIIAFAAASVTEALVQDRMAAIRHTHDGSEADSLISAEFLIDRFNPAHWFHSVLAYNHYPQYLHRGGYQTDALNRNNSMLGQLHIGPTSATPANTGDIEDLATSSYKLTFSDPSTGPRIWWNVADNNGGAVGGTGKLDLDTLPVRITEGLYLGALVTKSYLLASVSGADEVLKHLATGVDDGDVIFESGILRTRGDDPAGATVEFGNAASRGYLTHNYTGGLSSFEFETDGTNAQVKAGYYAARGYVLGELPHEAGSVRDADRGAVITVRVDWQNMIPSNRSATDGGDGSDYLTTSTDGWKLIRRIADDNPAKYDQPYWEFIDGDGGASGTLIGEVKIPPSVSARFDVDNDGMYFTEMQIYFAVAGNMTSQRMWAQLFRRAQPAFTGDIRGVDGVGDNVPIFTYQAIGDSHATLVEDLPRGIHEVTAAANYSHQAVNGGWTTHGLTPVDKTDAGLYGSPQLGNAGALTTTTYDAVIDTEEYRYYLVINTDDDNLKFYGAEVKIWCRYA